MAERPDPAPPTPDEERALAIKTAAELAETALALSTLVTSLVARVEALEVEDVKLVAEEAAELAETRHLSKIVSALQSQWLWICSGCILFGAAAGQLLTKAFG